MGGQGGRRGINYGRIATQRGVTEVQRDRALKKRATSLGNLRGGKK